MIYSVHRYQDRIRSVRAQIRVGDTYTHALERIDVAVHWGYMAQRATKVQQL